GPEHGVALVGGGGGGGGRLFLGSSRVVPDHFHLTLTRIPRMRATIAGRLPPPRCVLRGPANARFLFRSAPGRSGHPALKRLRGSGSSLCAAFVEFFCRGNGAVRRPSVRPMPPWRRARAAAVRSGRDGPSGEPARYPRAPPAGAGRGGAR